MRSGSVPPLVFTSIFSRIAQLGFRTKLFGGLWLAFFLLVLLRIHGSSIYLSSKFWAPTQTHFIAQPIVDKLSVERAKKLRGPLMADAKMTRSDEWQVSTMWSLAQFHHEPRFPVINTNLGLGQNMLLVPWVPVLHVSALARPVTWGYMLLGQQMGLAWYWWFSPFFCFTTLYLVLERIFPRDRFLALLGAFWFGASAYVICWSHYPAYLVGFANLTLLGAHEILIARRPLRAALGGGMLGYGASGVIMYLYVPWIVPLAYTYAAILLGLIIRDRLLQTLNRRFLLMGLGVALGGVALLLGSFLASSFTQLNALAQSAYPGIRRLTGGDCSMARLFGGFYNFLTLRKSYLRFPSSEWAGFFLFLPTVLLGALLSKKVRRRMDAIAWCLLPLGVALALYGEFKFPQWLSNITLWSRFQGYRAQLATGFISIILSLYLLRRDPAAAPASPERDNRDDSEASPLGPAALDAPFARNGHGLRLAQRWAVLRARARPLADKLGPLWRPIVGLGRYEWLILGAIVVGSFGFFLLTGTTLHGIARLYRTRLIIPWPMWVVSGGAAVAALLLLRGHRRLFTTALVPALLLTAGDFNPVSRGFAPIEESEMYQAIAAVKAADHTAGKSSMFLVSGGPHFPIIGITALAMGAKTLTGVFFHPQLQLWHTLDPEARQEPIYNRYSETHFFPLLPGDPTVRFTLPQNANFNVRAAPDNPRLQALNVRYALTYDRHTPYEGSQFPRIYMSADRRLRIYRLMED
jgi:hypothetical protein